MSISSDNPGRADLRLKLSLDGVWDFSFEGPGAGLSGSDHRIWTPGNWQAQFAALRNVQGVGRYRRRIDIPSDWTSRSLVLVMEGVFYEFVVMIDRVPIAIHGDGWTPIEVDLTTTLDGMTSFVLGVEARTPDDRSGGRFSVSLAGTGTAFRGNLEAGAPRGARSCPHSFTKRSFLGKGWITVSTFDFTSQRAAENPLAPHLLRSIAES